MAKRQTVGALQVKASADSTKYDSLDVGHALIDDVLSQIRLCIENHRHIIDENEFCVVMVLADDPLIKGVMRRKFYAWPYLPSPRPRQSCFLYNKTTDQIKRLWVLPEAFCMAALSDMITVSKPWKTMKAWSTAFFNGSFWESIRKEHGIDMPSETEFLNANREKLIKAGCKQIVAPVSNPFDFSKVSAYKVVDP